eukprot:TRINITY_DN13348_c0_g1_i1.p1 TRINITY_DN13348_c0_g1~~TRINITY_DN13348_c0_g1_i1.p1  ORF type:complete len:246 (+),score=68.64 TRINITY_DN13348_c0_g1_i1:35-739(+)
MANRTDKAAKAVHGVDPQNLVETIVKNRIYNNMYWKEHCFGLSAEGVIEQGVKLNAVGGSYGDYRKPTKFLCLVLKMLQLQPEIETVLEFIKQDDFKYVKVLGAFYLRLVGSPLQIYEYLEPLLGDYRKIRMRNLDGKYSITYIDELVDQFLNESNVFDCTLPRIPPRRVLENNDILQPLLTTVNNVNSDEDDEDDDDEEDDIQPPPPPPAPPAAAPTAEPSRKRRRTSSEDLD